MFPANAMREALTDPETTVLVKTVAAGQLLAPHWYPIGQHPPPKLPGHANHPDAQPVSVAGPKPALAVPLLIVTALSGQFVMPQSLPILQHPPLYCAEQV